MPIVGYGRKGHALTIGLYAELLHALKELRFSSPVLNRGEKGRALTIDMSFKYKVRGEGAGEMDQ